MMGTQHTHASVGSAKAPPGANASVVVWSDAPLFTEPERAALAWTEAVSHPEAREPIRSAARHGRLTLVYRSHDTEQYLSARRGKKRMIHHA